MSSRLASRACLLSTALASVLTLGASAPAMADVFAFGQTGKQLKYESLGELDLGSAGSIGTNGNQGWVTDALNSGATHTAGAAQGASTTYTAGACSGANQCQKATNHNNYFVFSLAGIKGPVTTAKLDLNWGQVVGTGYYNIYDATDLSSTLLAGPTGSTPDLYNHLTTQGALIGQIKFTDDDTGKQLSNFYLNDLGLRDLNYDIAHGVANFAIGGAVTTPDAASPSDPFPPSPIDPPPPPSAPSPVPGVGLLQALGLLGLLAFAAARARSRT